ncbi:acetyl esterase [Arthrobacter sp. AG367]|uniref:alpha/beta hydrolase n=1 Tax=Arthrobacter sp. AG367 TaxID=2572909 RepID=UPI0011A2DEE9|nr:alpha/beta hydrolase [Arthrobacter sp. AG367]TWD47060.1 acetyl esterase [Arthrobacter sp. AG367]
MTVHPDARRFLEIVSDAPPLDTQTAEQNRADLDKAIPLTGTKTEVFVVEDLSIEDIPVRVYRPVEGNHPLPAVVYFHGGGWVMGDIELADTAARDLATGSKAVLISVDYRKAPEDVFPAALEDAVAIVSAVLDGRSGFNIDTQRVAVAGDSAGGNLTAVVAQELRGHHPSLVHQVLIYPVTDLAAGDNDSRRDYGDDHFLTTRDLEYFYSTYAHGANRTDPRLSPLRNADLSNLPPATVITAECDPLRDEGEAYARAMAEAGTPVTSVRFNGQVHPFFYLAGVIGDAHVARRFVGSQLAAAFSLVD